MGREATSRKVRGSTCSTLGVPALDPHDLPVPLRTARGKEGTALSSQGSGSPGLPAPRGSTASSEPIPSMPVFCLQPRCEGRSPRTRCPVRSIGPFDANTGHRHGSELGLRAQPWCGPGSPAPERGPLYSDQLRLPFGAFSHKSPWRLLSLGSSFPVGLWVGE